MEGPFQPIPFGPGLVLHRRLGAGGMAEVFRGVQTGLGGFQKVVAIKRMLPNLADSADFERMFQAEVNLTARLQHPNIVQVFGNGEHDNYLYVVMEFVDGRDLAKILTLLAPRGEALPIPLSVLIGIEVARALDYAHNFRDPATGQRECLVHRDISPQNVMVSFDGQIKVVDFGIAKVTDGVEGTRTGTIRGKLAYMAPEQAAGEPFDHRIDVFALGVVLFECLTGTRLFRGTNQADTLRRVLACEIPRPSSKNLAIPPELDAIVLRALAKNAADRYPTAQALQRDLSSYLAARAPGVVSGDLGAFMTTLFSDSISAERDSDRVISSEYAPTAMTPASSSSSVPKPVASAPRLLVVPARAPDSGARGWLWAVVVAAIVATGGVLAWRGRTPTAQPRMASEIEGLAGWYRADLLTLGPNERVARWPSTVREVDADAVQDDPARQPIYQAGVIAGSAAVSFDGEKQFLIADPLTNALREASGITVTFVARTMHDRAQFVLAIQEEDPNVDVARIGFTKPDAVRVKVSERGGRDYLDSSSQLLYGFAIYTLVIDRNVVSVFMDGKAILEKPAVTPAFSAARRVSIGQEWDDGGAPSDFFAGQLAELVVYGRALETEERRSLEAYLAKKYALTY